MTTFDLCIAWNWPYDADFVNILEQACQRQGITVLRITPENLDASYQALLDQTLHFRAFMNRAADTDPAFLKVVDWARAHGVFRINPHERETYTADKATMHLELIANGLNTPHSIILAPFAEQPALPADLDLRPLGPVFAIKPANGGGGEGVIVEATSAEQVAQARQQFPHDKYLLQAYVTPAEIDGQPAWFRVIYCLGEIYASWWPPRTHIFRPVYSDEVVALRLGELFDMAVRIASVSRLHLFSTEIALTPHGQFLAVDYVNDQIDLRLQSQAPDGVPDAIVQDICRRLAELVWQQSNAHREESTAAGPASTRDASARDASARDASARDASARDASARDASADLSMTREDSMTTEDNNSTTPDRLPTRGELEVATTWNAESVFPSTEAWEAEFARVAASLPSLHSFAGRLAEGPQTLLAAREASETLMRRLWHLAVYSGLDSAVDTTNQAATERNGRVQGLFGQFMGAAAYLEPELLAIGHSTLQQWMADEPQLAIYAHYFEGLFRRQAHVRSAEVEELLGLAAEPFAGASNAWAMLTDADIQFQPAIASDGRELPLSQSTYDGLLNNPDRAVRRTAYERYTDQYLAHKNTITSNLLTSVRQNVLQMRARRYDSTLAMALFDNAIPEAVFHNLIETFRKHLPVWHRYWAVRRKALGVETLQPYDIWAPLTAQPAAVSYQQAIAWICEALAPLGQDYVDILRRGCLEQRWIDVYPNQGKGSGAFSSGAPGTHPFIMMSYTDDSHSLGTLAHELGHSMHSYLTWHSQPLVYCDYSLFAAEVASNFHQAMTRAYLLDPARNLPRELQIGIIEEAMSNFHRYFLVMPTLARFELEVHQRIERGEGLTADGMIELLAELSMEGFGDEMALDRERVGIGWATFGHLYADYYVFQYATGISGAHALSNRILSGVPGAAEDYLGFLRAGSSLYPLDALRQAGVDLASPQPVEETFAVLSRLIDRLEALVAG
jgi:oligoendopeptidase F